MDLLIPGHGWRMRFVLNPVLLSAGVRTEEDLRSFHPWSESSRSISPANRALLQLTALRNGLASCGRGSRSGFGEHLPHRADDQPDYGENEDAN